MEVSSWFHATAALLLGTAPPAPTELEAAGLHSWSGHLGEERNLLCLPGIETWIVQPIA